MKKTIVLMMIVVIIYSIAVVSMGSVAFAEEEIETGYDLREDYLAEIIFGNFNMTNGNIIRSFTITFDKEFFNALPEEGTQNKQSLLDFMSSFTLAVGYKPEVDTTGRIIGAKKYDSSTDMYIEFGLDGYENDSSDYEKTNTIFYSKVISKQKTIFEGIENSDGSLNMLLAIMNMYGLENKDIALSYHYGSPYKIIDSDAERNYFDVKSRIYVHEFYMNVATANREIVLIQTIPNVLNWYLLAIAITVPIILVSVISGLVWTKKQRKGGAR